MNLAMPKKYSLVASFAEGKTKLTAFDNALLKVGLGNINLLKLSSILPPGAKYTSKFQFPPGILLPIVYCSFISNEPGALISAAVGIGIYKKEHFGVIMEYSGFCSKIEAERKVVEMLMESFEIRGLLMSETHAIGVEHRVEKLGCVFAGVPLWY